MPIEQWQPIVGYEDAYEVSDRGRVRSVDRYVSNGNGLRLAAGRVLSIYHGGHYSQVRLKTDGNGSTKNVHALMASAFLGPCPEGREVCHNNGQHHDNRIENLRYDTHSANQYDTVRLTGTAWTRRTHCKNNHEFTPENTIQRVGAGESGRRCLTCQRERDQRRWQEELRRRAEAV